MSLAQALIRLDWLVCELQGLSLSLPSCAGVSFSSSWIYKPPKISAGRPPVVLAILKFYLDHAALELVISIAALLLSMPSTHQSKLVTN